MKLKIEDSEIWAILEGKALEILKVNSAYKMSLSAYQDITFILRAIQKRCVNFTKYIEIFDGTWIRSHTGHAREMTLGSLFNIEQMYSKYLT